MWKSTISLGYFMNCNYLSYKYAEEYAKKYELGSVLEAPIVDGRFQVELPHNTDGGYGYVLEFYSPTENGEPIIHIRKFHSYGGSRFNSMQIDASYRITDIENYLLCPPDEYIGILNKQILDEICKEEADRKTLVLIAHTILSGITQNIKIDIDLSKIISYEMTCGNVNCQFKFFFHSNAKYGKCFKFMFQDDKYDGSYMFKNICLEDVDFIHEKINSIVKLW